MSPCQISILKKGLILEISRPKYTSWSTKFYLLFKPTNGGAGGGGGHKTQPRDKTQRHFTPSSAGHSVKQHFPVRVPIIPYVLQAEAAYEILTKQSSAYDLVLENLVKSLLFWPNAC